MTQVRLKPQGPGPIGARTARHYENLQSRATLGREITRKKIRKYVYEGGPQSLSCLRARRDHDPALFALEQAEW